MLLKKYLHLIVVFLFLLIAPVEVFASSDVCESPEELHKKKMERFMMNDIPSILDDCGLGNLLNFCNNPYLKLIGKTMGLCGGLDVGMGDVSSNFCGIGFKLPDITSIYISQRSELKENLRGGESLLASHSVNLKSSSVKNTDTADPVIASADEIKIVLGI